MLKNILSSSSQVFVLKYVNHDCITFEMDKINFAQKE